MRINEQADALIPLGQTLTNSAMNRRKLIRGIGALGALAVAGGRLTSVLAHGDSTPAAGAPLVGPQDDGTTLWRVQVAGADMDNGIELMGFFPAEITIAAGDSIFFDFSTGMPEIPHTVSFLGGTDVPDLVIQETATGDSNVDNPRLMFNPDVAFPKGEATIKSGEFISSGFDILMAAGSSYVVTFPEAGTFPFVDLVFPMIATGTVTVLETGAALPKTQSAYDSETSKVQGAQVATGMDEIEEYGKPAPEALSNGTNRWTVTAGTTTDNVEVAAFIPTELKIKTGDTVQWSLEQTSLELHTATFAGPDAPPELLLIEPQEGGNPKLVLNPVLVAPAGDGAYDGSAYANTGFLSTRFPFPQTGEIVFATPGEYDYYCAIHGSPNSGMRGKIIVE